MEFALPTIHDIAIDIDGRRFEGSWYVTMNDMIVNYNGHTASTAERATSANEIALDMLGDLVRDHYVDLKSIPSHLPPAVRQAAHYYLNSLDDDQTVNELVASFGQSTVASQVHRQLSWLCVNALGMIVPFWKLMCDNDAPEQTFRGLRQWLDDPSHPVDWSTARRPSVAMRDGVKVSDCDSCRLEPTADAVAQTADYLQTADASSVVAALLFAAGAYDEGCHSPDTPDRFEKWLVFGALLPACQCKPVD